MPLAAEPPEEEGKFLRIIKIECGPEYDFTILTPGVLGIWTHFVDTRTIPCFKDVTGSCEFCGNTTSRRWYGYLAAYSHRSKQRVIVPLPKGAFQSCPVLKGAKGDLTGKQLRAWRTGGHPRGRVICRLNLLLDRETAPKERVDKASLMAQLFWIWGIRVKEEEKNGRP